ncbi:MAG: 4-hydroxy-tetrahydrodipicolinate reductase, partial [Chloroflexota bacterium]
METNSNKARVCIAGATGWAGSALARGIVKTDDMELVAAISRSHAGKILGEAIGVKGLVAPVFGTVDEALATRPDVFVEYTKPEAAKFHALSALKSGAHVVIGTSGLGAEDYEEIDRAAQEVKRGVLAV